MRGRKDRLKAVCIIIAAVMTLTSCAFIPKTGSLYEEPGSDYKIIRDVEGIAFGVPAGLAATATAVTEINNSSDFSQAGTYVFKDGRSRYILFNISTAVVVAERGTNFNAAEGEDNSGMFDRSSIMGIWMTRTSEKDQEYHEGRVGDYFKIIADVNAEAIITDNLYDDYIGRFAYIRSGNEEAALFIGVPGTSTKDDVGKDLAEVFDAVTKSLCFAAPVQDNGPVYEVTAGDIQSTEETTMEGEYITVSPEDESGNEGETEEGASGESTEAMEETGAADAEQGEEGQTEPESAEGVTISVDTEPQGENVPESSQDGTEAETSAEETPPAETTPAEKEPPETEPETETETEPESTRAPESRPAEGERTGLNIDNQSSAPPSLSGVMDSSIYSFLHIGQKGSVELLSDTGQPEPLAVLLDTVYTGDSATNLIREFCSSGQAGYLYSDPPVGTIWNVAEFTIDYSVAEDKPYLNCRIVGADGEVLKHAGIAYSSRSYDMEADPNGDGTGYRVYYSVPANCREYVLVFGDGSEARKKAYYLIKY